MRKIISIFSLCMLLGISVLAQQNVTIRGKVVGTDGLGIPGASIVEKGTNNGITSDSDGNYTLSVSPNSTIVYSFVGMASREEQVNGREIINVTLEQTNVGLDEVVVTALGVTREKKALGYAVSEVDGDDLSVVKESNPINSLTGKVAGVVVTTSGAGLGSGSRITIRGNNSISANNQPLIVVDGIPIDNTGGNSGGNVYESRISGGGISDINPDDIASISVLKGPNAAALYGSRAGNGVILITTKMGKKGNGLGVTVNSNITFENPLLLPDYQNMYGQGTNGSVPATLSDLKNSSASWGSKFDGSDKLYYTGEQRPYEAAESNVEDFFRTGKRYINSFSVDGGGEGYNIRFSYTNNTTESMLPNSDLMSHNFNLRGYADLTDKFYVDSKVTYFNQIVNNQPSIGSQGVMSFLLTMPRNIRLNDLKNYQNLEEGLQSVSYGDLGANPYWMLEHDRYEDRRERVMGFGKLGYKFTDFLSAFVRIGTDVTNNRTENVLQYGHHYKGTGYLRFANSRAAETNADFLFLFEKDLNEDFNLSMNFGGTHSYRTYESSSVAGEDFKIPTRATVANLRNVYPPGYTPLTEKIVNSLYGSASLSMKKFLFLDVTGRNDWSSTLPKENLSYFYPSVSLSAVLSEALDLPSQLKFLKLRASWAMVGNDTSPYQIFDYYVLAGDGYNGTTQVSKLSTKLNPDLKPEKITSSEIGLEFRALDNRLYGDLSFYNIVTEDLIFDVDVPKSSGYDKERTNIGEMENKGVEFMIGGMPVKTKDFEWDISVNFSKNENKLVSLTEDLDSHPLNTTNSGNIVLQATVGGGYGDIYGTTWKRNDAGEIVLNAEGKPQASSEKVYLGNAQPDWIGGLTNTFRYKNVSLRFLIDGRFGGELYSGTGASLDASGVSEASLEYRDGGIVVDGVIENEENGNITYVKNTNNITAEKYWGSVSGIASEYIYEQTNIRLRELSLSYSLPKSMLGSTFIKDASISFVGRNLFFIYKDLDHFDPEASLGTSNNAQGILYYNLPSARTLGFNINVKF